MAIRYQLQDKKHPYSSPTTPGLYITFRAFIIELVCLNVNKKLGPRFWSDNTYWGPKFRREVRGVFNLNKELDLTDTLTQTALIQIVKEYNIKALVAKKTITKIVRLTHRQVAQLKDKREILARKSQSVEIDSSKNAVFVDTGDRNILAKIKALENNKNA